jgi:hypothetical protein
VYTPFGTIGPMNSYAAVSAKVEKLAVTIIDKRGVWIVLECHDKKI